MQMPADLIEKLVAESPNGISFTADDSGTNDMLIAPAPTTRKSR